MGHFAAWQWLYRKIERMKTGLYGVLLTAAAEFIEWQTSGTHVAY